MKRIFGWVGLIVLLTSSILPHSYTQTNTDIQAGSTSQPGWIIDLYPEKARYNPGEAIGFQVELANRTGSTANDLQAVLTGYDLGSPVGAAVQERFDLPPGERRIRLEWIAPRTDYRGYPVELRLLDTAGTELDRAVTAADVSSDWSRFPRYGYLAHFGKEIDTEAWVAELNKYHLNGLQFYDFQYKHHRPLAGTVIQPLDEWRDIAGRTTSRATIQNFIAAAHRHQMTAMAYNASYGAYADAFRDGSGVKLEWAAWDNSTDPRTEDHIKSLGPFPSDWATPKLYYMNQNCKEWQEYIFAQMAALFEVYPFDGWHIDTYGDKGAYAFDGGYIDYISGFRSFTDNARRVLGKPVVFNTVSSLGQDLMAKSQAEFVYSELWEDHPTYQSLLDGADEIHRINPEMGVVFPAYMHKPLADTVSSGSRVNFNTPSVLLSDAVIFAAGASRLELGDGDRMLSGPYFPADDKLVMTPELREKLRRYYDFLVGYENYLRYNIEEADSNLQLLNYPSGTYGEAGVVWTFTRRKENYEMIHLINLTGLKSNGWRDNAADYPDAPLLQNLKARLTVNGKIQSIGWASPDVDGGRFHPLPFQTKKGKAGQEIDLTISSLKYWDMIVIKY